MRVIGLFYLTYLLAVVALYSYIYKALISPMFNLTF